MRKTVQPRTVDAYIAAAPKKVQGNLRELRRIIRRAAPAAQERISYRMPYYAWKGRLAYFAAFQKHISLFIPTPIVAEHRKELKGYQTAAATIRFPLDKKLPAALIRKLVKARLRRNEGQGR